MVLTRRDSDAGVWQTMLTSCTNPRVKHAIRVREGDERGLLFAEGERLVEDLAASGLEIIHAFHHMRPSTRTSKLLESLQQRGIECFPAQDSVMKTMSDTVHPQGIIALAKRPAPLVLQEFSCMDGRPVVVLNAVQDPGNVGTILRSAEAAGAGAVMTLPGTADPFSPKVLRSAMGSAFRLPLIRVDDFAALLPWAERTSTQLVATAGDAALSYTDYDWRQPTALVLGNEARGVSAAVLSTCNGVLRIPMHAPVESLNVASAAAVILFEAARQRNR
jgi:RNA methyltransferase, TrmH family